MIANLAMALLICFGVYAAIASSIVLALVMRGLPDRLSDGLDAVVTTGARIVRPGVSKAQIDSWCELTFMYSLAVLAIGALYLIGQSALWVLG